MKNEIYSMPMDIDKELSYHVFAYIGQKDGEVELVHLNLQVTKNLSLQSYVDIDFRFLHQNLLSS